MNPRLILRLATTSVAAFCSLAPAEREAARCALGEWLGAEFEVMARAYGRLGLFCARHREWRLRFLLVPGGEFEMGLRESDLEQAAEFVDWTRDVAQTVERAIEAARPLRRVRVAPFLCARSTLTPRQVERASAGALHADQLSADKIAPLLARCAGFRLPSEAELEYLARDGGEQAFTYDGARLVAEGREWPQHSAWGFRNLTLGEWAADSWHPSYERAPITSAAWNEGSAPGVVRGALPGGIDHPSDIIHGLAALRHLAIPGIPHEPRCLRLARTLEIES